MFERLAERKGARVVSAAGEGTDTNDPTSQRRFVLWPTGRQEWTSVAVSLIWIVGAVLLVLGFGLMRTLVQEGHPLPYLVAFVWVGYRLVKAIVTFIRRHRPAGLTLTGERATAARPQSTRSTRRAGRDR